MSELRIMDREAGDLRVTWDPNVPAEVAAARAQFDSLIGRGGKGYMAYKVQAGGGKGEQIRQFDPNAEAIILAPAMVGG